MKQLYAFLFLWMFLGALGAQTTKVQVIHNSPSAAVDIYANGVLLLDDFAFRTSSPFVDVPTGIQLIFAICPANSTSANDAIFYHFQTFQAGRIYTMSATGIFGSATRPFFVNVEDDARLVATDPTKVEITFMHGAPDAPVLSFEVVGGSNLLPGLPYNNYTDYLSLTPGVYDLLVRPVGDTTVLGIFRADLTALAGQVLTITASGLLNGMPEFGLLATPAVGNSYMLLPPVITTIAQFIHNAPDQPVDIYVNGSLYMDDFAYRTASVNVNLLAGAPIAIAIAPGNSTSVFDAIATNILPLDAAKNYILTATGIAGSTTTPLGFNVNDNARLAATDPTMVDVSIMHGSPDVIAVDVELIGVGNIILGLAYNSYTNYQAYAPGVYDIRLKPAGDTVVLGIFRADLSALGGKAVQLTVSGLLQSTTNVGILATLTDGSEFMLPTLLAPSPLTTKVQIIHNSPTPTIDVYANGVLLLNDFVYRTATPYLNLPRDVQTSLAIAPSTSTSANDAVLTVPVLFETNKTYIVTALGVVLSASAPFRLDTYNQARSVGSDPAKVDISILHGASDAPAVDISVAGLGAVATNLAYGQSTPYATVTPALYEIAVKLAGTNTIVGTYRGDLTALAGQAVRITATGLVGNNTFGLLATLADGTCILLQLVPPPVINTKVQLIHNSPSPTVDVYANGALLLNDFAFRTATPFVDMPSGAPLSVAIAPGTSTSVNDAIATFAVNFDATKRYIITANGIVGNATTPFTLNAFDQAQIGAATGKVAISILHGAPGAPPVDIEVVGVGNIVANLAYGQTTPGYLDVAPAVYTIIVKLAGTNTAVGWYKGDLTALGGHSVRITASGLVGGAPAFGLLAVVDDGTSQMLPETVGADDLSGIVTEMVITPNPAHGTAVLSLQLAQTTDLTMRIFDAKGSLVRTQPINAVTGKMQQRLDLTGYAKGVYYVQVLSASGLRTTKMIVE